MVRCVASKRHGFARRVDQVNRMTDRVARRTHGGHAGDDFFPVGDELGAALVGKSFLI